eukprot:15144514-Ditylum_brightwellii.AAC.1
MHAIVEWLYELLYPVEFIPGGRWLGQCEVASDGSASEQENTMSFDWAISLLDSKTLATHSGPVFGHASLCQAKGYSLLSVTCFLYHLQSCTQRTPACNGYIYKDNKGVVTRTNNQTE